MKFKFLFIVSVLFVLHATPMFTEYYQWTDKGGRKHFIDDVSEIPQDQRSDLDIYKSIKTPEKKISVKKQNTILPESLVKKRTENFFQTSEQKIFKWKI
jgi:hypothetical protein